MALVMIEVPDHIADGLRASGEPLEISRSEVEGMLHDQLIDISAELGDATMCETITANRVRAMAKQLDAIATSLGACASETASLTGSMWGSPCLDQSAPR
jgi:hypothetical protein